MSSESEGRRDEGAGDDCYASPDPQELALSADREFRAAREDRQSIRDEHRRVKENLMATIQQLSARVGELEPHVGSVHSLQKQLKQLELEYGAFQRRVNANLKDKADHLTLVMDQLHIMRTLGTPVDTMKELLERTARDLRAGFQEGLTSLHTALATSGVPSQAASEDEQQGTEEQEEGEAPGMDQPRVQFVPVQQPPSTSEPRPPKDIAAAKGANKQQQPQQQQPRKQGGGGRNPGGGRGSGGQSKRQRGNGLDPATFARFQQFEQWQKSQGN